MGNSNLFMTATNTLTGGLLMDLNPTMTPGDVLTNALNATVLTGNGNEKQLQQDMGNGRVETAFLPEGYVPVGACEYGDIIYIVSYNPLEDKSQIGCFPSPERNVTSDEITDMEQDITAGDFQKMGGGTPTGALVATAVKRIVYGNKDMNPGDKYIIYETGAAESLKADKDTLSDYGNTGHCHDDWPKLVKLKVVSVEESGKIVDLNASVKWYDNDYYLTHLNTSASSGKPDIDSYRSLVSSAYAVFRSKVSGKLAILAELEAIDGFGCTYDVYTEPVTQADGSAVVRHTVYLYSSWDTSHNDVNPSGLVVTKSAWTSDNGGGHLYVPKYGRGMVTYVPDENPLALPVDGAASFDGQGQVSGYDASKVIAYSRLYSLESPAADFTSYYTGKSYNALIGGIMDWRFDGEQYMALADSGSRDNLRDVTRATLVTDGVTGLPVEGECHSYVYNLDHIETGVDGLEYYTKGIDGTLVRLNAVALTDDVVNNGFRKDVPKQLVSGYEIRQSQYVTDGTVGTVLDCDMSRLVWNFTVAPAMPYGVLDHMSLNLTLDFSKVNSGIINLNEWRYYVSGNVATLTWGLEAYVEQNKGIAEVTMDFYDNQGRSASLHVTGKSSFAGVFTERLLLGGVSTDSRVDSMDAYGVGYVHAGAESADGPVGMYTLGERANRPYALGDGQQAVVRYLNDAGVLYPNMLYLVRVTVKYCPKNLMGDYLTDNVSGFKTFYRWFWTNGIFNDNYYSVKDFTILRPRLDLDYSVTFDTRGGITNALVPERVEYMNDGDVAYADDMSNNYKTLGASVYCINQNCRDDAKGNILMRVEPGFADGYGTFNLNEAALASVDKVSVTLGPSSIVLDGEAPVAVHDDGGRSSDWDSLLKPEVSASLCSHMKGKDRSGYACYGYGATNSHVSDGLLRLFGATRQDYSSDIDPVADTAVNEDKDELYGTAAAFHAYKDSFSLNFAGIKDFDKLMTGKFSYYGSDGSERVLGNADGSVMAHYNQQTVTLRDARDGGLRLVLTGTAYSKLYASELKDDTTSKTLKSVLRNETGDYDSLKAAGLHLTNDHLFFTNVRTWHMGEPVWLRTRWGAYYSKGITGSSWQGTAMNGTPKVEKNHLNLAYDDDRVQELWNEAGIDRTFAGFMICRADIQGTDAKIYTFSNKNWDVLHDAFGYTVVDDYNMNKIHHESNDIPKQNPSQWEDSNADGYTTQRMIHSFMVSDETNNKIVPVADWFIGGYNSQYAYISKPSAVLPALTLADMIGSLVLQLYVQDTTVSGGSAIWSDCTMLQPYTEIWKKDIIIDIDTSGMTDDAVDELVTIRRQTAVRYKGCMRNNSGLSGVWDDIDKTNVTFALFGVKRPVEFQYSVPYDTGNMPQRYADRGTALNKIVLATVSDTDTAPVTKSFSGEVDANTLYMWADGNVVPFGSNVSLKYASKFKVLDGQVCMVEGKSSMKTSSFGDLSECMYYSNGKLHFRNLNRMSGWLNTYDIKYKQGGTDEPSLTGLPTISFFNEFKPGM